MKKPNPLQHAMDRFSADPSSVRNAAYVMIVITVGVVIVGGVIVWVFDRKDFPDLGGALWYTLQTVTTVGYGDKVPTEGTGRLVGAAVMIVAVALIAILTASITSTFVEAAQRRHRAGQEAQERDSAEALHRQLEEVIARLAAVEAVLEILAPCRRSGCGGPGEAHRERRGLVDRIVTLGATRRLRTLSSETWSGPGPHDAAGAFSRSVFGRGGRI